VDQIGWVYKKVVLDDVTLDTNLLTKAKKELGKYLEDVSQLEITALDLFKVGLTVDNFSMFDYITFNAGMTKGQLMVTKLSTDLLNPQNGFLVMGSDYGDFTTGSIDNDNKIGEIIIDGSPGQDWGIIGDAIRKLWTQIKVTYDQIMTEVGQTYVTNDDFGTTIDSVTSQIQQLADSVNFIFNQVHEEIVDGDSGLQDQFDSITRYIRFSIDGIELGEMDSPFKLLISLDRISFMISGAEVAYFSNDKLYVMDGEFLNSLQIAGFGFVPNNSGNLSFVRIGGS
jgi:hypothetical protein